MASFRDQLCEVIALEAGLDADGVGAVRGLMSTGILDSFATIAVITMVSSHLGHEIAPEDLNFANFDSVDAICTFVGRVHAP